MKFKIITLIFISLFFWILIRKHNELIKIPKEERKLIQVSEGIINDKVIKVSDGDSFTLSNGTIIRLYGIDAPELNQTCTMSVKIDNEISEPIIRYKNIKCGENAKNKLSEMILNNEISCTIIGKDAYDRLVANCTLQKYNSNTKSYETININKEMVSTGNAVAFQQITDEYLEDENEAKLENRGIWATTFDPPYIYRKKNEK